ncbi:hypothetical protein DAI22_02g074900 [Oryza sativa Japonica Group]|nr:hypothetical protein DAI22_02g074900 [Oryza sativa Japonica Group]
MRRNEIAITKVDSSSYQPNAPIHFDEIKFKHRKSAVTRFTHSHLPRVMINRPRFYNKSTPKKDQETHANLIIST